MEERVPCLMMATKKTTEEMLGFRKNQIAKLQDIPKNQGMSFLNNDTKFHDSKRKMLAILYRYVDRNVRMHRCRQTPY